MSHTPANGRDTCAPVAERPRPRTRRRGDSTATPSITLTELLDLDVPGSEARWDYGVPAEQFARMDRQPAVRWFRVRGPGRPPRFRAKALLRGRSAGGGHRWCANPEGPRPMPSRTTRPCSADAVRGNRRSTWRDRQRRDGRRRPALGDRRVLIGRRRRRRIRCVGHRWQWRGGDDVNGR
jgi:hypothetical protein